MIDYMIAEAVAVKVAKADEKAVKDAERERWKKDSDAVFKQLG